MEHFSVDTAGSGNNSDDVISHGLYASVDYDINEQLTLSAEARMVKKKKFNNSSASLQLIH